VKLGDLDWLSCLNLRERLSNFSERIGYDCIVAARRVRRQ